MLVKPRTPHPPQLSGWGPMLRQPCPICGARVEPVLGVTLVQDGAGYRQRCLTCEPVAGKRP